MIDHGLADLAAGSGEIVEHAGRQPRVADAVGQQPPGPRRVGRALQHDGVAGDQGGRHRAGRQRQGKVERRDHHPRAVRAKHAAVARGGAGDRIVRQVPLVGVVALELIGVDLEEVGRFLRLGERLQAILADLEHQGGGDVVDALGDQCADLARQLAAALRRRGAPGGEGSGGGRHGRLDILAAGVAEGAQTQAFVYRADLRRTSSPPAGRRHR